jgi:hypothetical protein
MNYILYPGERNYRCYSGQVNNKLSFVYIICIFLLGASQSSMAQNISKIQTKSIKAPVNIKIDGKINDWNNRFEAYNKSTGFFYSIANDDNNLYLIIQAVDPLIEKKILRAGVTVSLRGFEQGKNWFKLTFPLLDEDMASGIGVYLSEDNLKEIKNGEKKGADSLLKLMNNRLALYANKIGASGTVLLEDSVISIYNDKGIRAAALFDNKAALTYEIAIPLKYLPGSADAGIDYDIKSNGIFTHVKVRMLDPNANPNTAGMVVIGSSITGKTTSDIQVLNSDTDFSGKYQLAKGN